MRFGTEESFVEILLYELLLFIIALSTQHSVLIPIYIEHTALAAFLKNGYEVSELSRAGV